MSEEEAKALLDLYDEVRQNFYNGQRINGPNPHEARMRVMRKTVIAALTDKK